MRKIISHKINPCNDKIEIDVVDEPGVGGANHEYHVKYKVTQNSKTFNNVIPISFQNGPINETGVNGITQEVLLAICIDRLQSFQKGPYACRENALALAKMEEAQHWLHHRTSKRMQRGVEGTHKV